jgi:hypothetical protein
MMPILSNYQEGTRNAKVYKTASGDYGVIVYDAQDDFNGYESFQRVNDAEDFAEDWVLRAGR